MTVGELLETIRRGKAAGTLLDEDTVMIRDVNVSDAAMSAGSTGYVEADETIIVRENDEGLERGLYFMLEASEY